MAGLNKLQIAYMVAVIICAVLIGVLWLNLQDQVDRNSKARETLCALRLDLINRANDAKRDAEGTIIFVNNHGGRKGEAFQGIPNALLFQGAQQKKLTASDQLATARLINKKLDCE